MRKRERLERDYERYMGKSARARIEREEKKM